MVVIRIHPCNACRACFEVPLDHSAESLQPFALGRGELRPVAPAPPPFCPNCVDLFGYERCAFFRRIRNNPAFARRAFRRLSKKGRKNFRAFFGGHFVEEILSPTVSPAPTPPSTPA